MSDLEIAKQRLADRRLTLSIVKNGKILFETGLHGISGFLEAIGKIGILLRGASVADRVAGKAVALLCVYAGIKKVYVATISQTAKATLREHGIAVEYERIVAVVLDAKKTKICPFEELAQEMNDPEEAYRKLKECKFSKTHGMNTR